ncbi:MAG TPA: hypothetical protein VLJ76_07420 [Gaiellaceae bacterium]|nr:hypothetical protein [Gaiellaceae bacterium]
MTAWSAARIDELADEGGWSPVRKHFGIEAFGVNAWTAAAGERLIPEHDEAPSGHEELYVVVSGHAVFTVDGDEIDAPKGTAVFVYDPAAERTASAREDGTTLLVAGAKPGVAYRPRSWELQVYALLDAGENAQAKQVLLESLDRYEDRGIVLYNLACAESLLGETDAALGHLREALAEEPSLAAHVQEDDDLASLRSDPRLGELL